MAEGRELGPNTVEGEIDFEPTHDIVEQDDGSVEVEFEFDTDPSEDPDTELADIVEHYDNLVDYISLDEESIIASDVIDGYEEDEESRAGHISSLSAGIGQLGLSDESVDTPFDGGCTVFHPLIMENAVKIQAKAEGELLPARGPVHAQVLGTVDDELDKQANRVKGHLNWQLTEQITEFYPNTQKGLLQTALLGDSFKKNYFDIVKGRAADVLIPVDRLVVHNSCDSLENAERITEIQYLSKREFLARQYGGQYTEDVDIGEPYKIEKEDIGMAIDSLLGMDGGGEGYIVYEQHCYLDLAGFEDASGVPLPYVVTVEKESRQVLAIRRNWKEDQDRFVKREWFTQYGFVPGFGFYNLGYIHLLGNFQMTLTAIMRSIVDAGSFANLQGGFKLKGMRVLDDGEAISPGEFRDIEFYGTDISKGIYPFNFKEPSSTLLAMLQFIETRGQKYADSAEQVVADAANYGPVGTTMALLDASTKFFSTIFKRFHAAQKKQLRLIAELNYENMPSDPEGITFNIPGMEARINRSDYDDRIDIIPVSDPNISSQTHRLTLASQKLQSAQMAPDIHNMKEVYKQYYLALGDENYEKYLPADKEAQRSEPMEDIMKAVNGEPIKAFEDQDHEAHIAVLTAFMNDPSVVGNPMFAPVLPALQANAQEHVVMRFKAQMDGGASLGMNAKQAAEEIVQFNQHKAENPLGQQDPKQMLAQAEQMKQLNDKAKIKLQEHKQQTDAALGIAELQKDIRKQNLDMVKIGLEMDNDNETKKFQEAINIVKEKMRITKDKNSLTSPKE